MCGGGASPLVRTFRPVGVVWVSQPMRVWTRGLNRSRKRRPPRGPCPPAFMLPLRLRRLWPHSPPTRFFAAAARQRSGPSNYYELLGVHPGASAEEVKRAFFSKSKELHPDRDPRNPALHSCFVELSEAYQVLSHEQSRRSYDHQLRSAASPKCPGTTAHPRSAHQAHSSSWAPPNAKYWAQFHEVRPQGPESRQQQHKHNRRVLGKLEQMHRSFMDEKDRIITAIYNDTRARARPRAPGPGPALRVLAAATREPGPLGGASPFPCCGRRWGVCRGGGPRRRPRPPSPTPPPPRGPVGSACLGHMSRPPASPGPAPRRPRRPRRPRCPSRPPPPPPAARPPGSSGRRRRCAALRCLRPGLGRGPRRSRPPRPAPARRSRARAMGLWLPPPPAPPG
ncbi:dnaJ homolog subfamily C member 4 isoform X5 [Eschrichtius robustus]|uniref:dnaJ homolog subfamily C member 4 isoform X5 n=1 Tax=Eschrichtius robustus TaxID=9764 RepID=UPI0035C055BF